ncbi:MAG TPA: Hsp70 family protein [Candidatus Limiplasma sp.]|nr:Hsp70 family protein [Candidatus Limiplasma sp.]
MRYIGFDMGDGESAVAIYQHGSGIEPIVQPIYGSQSLLSAVGTLNGEVVIGEQAYTSTLAEGLSVRFKSRFTDDPRSYEIITLFVRGVMKALREANAYGPDDHFVVGCPAGWNAAARARYRDILIRGGVAAPQVISESRAAFLYAKYAKTVALDLDLLRQSALVIDIGSSTLDFAYIVDGRETGVGTFGDTHLGGGLIDAEILRRAVDQNRDREAIRRVFEDSRSWYSYCEIEARKVKEQFYTRLAQDPAASVKKQLRICYRGTQKLSLTLDAALASDIVGEPMEALNGASFSQALHDALQNAKQITADAPPRLVLLTGGASRMPFFQEQCREAFADAVLVTCPEPEFSIAKGLAYAGWVDENLRAFRKAIRDEVTDERVGAIARAALPELTPNVAGALAELALAQAAIPVVESWRRGDIDTLQQMNEQMQRRIGEVLASPMAEEALAPALTQWMKTLSAHLQTMIDPICDRYQVPREEMRLHFTQSGDAATVQISAQRLLGFPIIGTMVGVVVSVVAALLCGGGGIALIAVGVPGLLAGAAIGVVAAAFGWPAITDALMKVSLPRVFRWIHVEKRLKSENTVQSVRDALMRELGNPEGAFAQQVVQGFTKAFQQYLYQIAQAAEIPIQ